ncbi:DUF3159 domain-containing protein [Flindersiella endophytica]
MSALNLLTARSLSLADAIGGWRTIAEAIGSRVLFLVVYLLTGRVLASALVAVGAVLVLALVRLRTQRTNWWQTAIPLGIVGLSALLAGGTGNAVDFYLPEMLPDLILGPIFLLSMLIRLPVIGLIVGGARGERLTWRHDRARRRRYQQCTAVFAAKFVIAAVVLLSLYAAGNVAALGVASVVLASPALGGCVYLCWRLLRRAGQSGAATDEERTAQCG